MQYLTFNLGGVDYAVDVRIIETVLPFEGAVSVPSPLPYLRGVMELRGQVIPLIDLRRKLGLPARAESEPSGVLVFDVEAGEAAQPGREGKGERLVVGALVDAVSEVIELGEAALDEAATGAAALWESYVEGVARHEGRLIVLIRPAGLFSLEELASIRRA